MNLQNRLESAFHHNAALFSGACLAKQGEYSLLSIAKGQANKDFAIPNRIDTRFDTASITKVFTAAATLLLVQSGDICLTDRIYDLIDLNGTAIPNDVTVKHLLSHTSGIADDADEEDGEDYAALFVDTPNYAIRNCADFLPQFAYKAPRFKAGTSVRYNNCAFILLGLAIEKRAKMSYRDFVTEQIFRKAGMEDTCFCAKDEVCKNRAEGYFAVRDEAGGLIEWKKNIYSQPPVGTSDAGAYTTVGDLDCFIRVLRDDRLLSPLYTDMLFSPQCPFTKPHRLGTWRMGYAFEFIESEKEIFCVYKEGCNAGVDAILSYYPALDVTLHLLANEDGGLWPLYRALQQVLLCEFNSYIR